MGKLFLISSILILFTVQTFAKCKTENCSLVLRGKIVDLEIDRSNKKNVQFYVNLAMEFKNESSEPIILFKPNTGNSYLEDRYWLGGYSLYLKQNEKPPLVDGAWESIMGSPFYHELAGKLDTKTPSNEYTKILKPNETWYFDDKTVIGFSAEEEDINSYPRRRSWKEMKELSSQFWLIVSYELNPWNVEYFKPKLIRKLRKRWKDFGNILIEKDSDSRFSHFTSSSEPMEIDFSKAKEKTTEVK